MHQTYRIQYLKDVVLPRVLDDATYATLSSMALFNSVEVIVALASDPTFLPQLFLKLKKHSPSGRPEPGAAALLPPAFPAAASACPAAPAQRCAQHGRWRRPAPCQPAAGCR